VEGFVSGEAGRAESDDLAEASGDGRGGHGHFLIFTAGEVTISVKDGGVCYNITGRCPGDFTERWTKQNDELEWFARLDDPPPPPLPRLCIGNFSFML
jgi:hypothetical protein